MRRIRIYQQNNLSTGLTVMLDAGASHHLLQVLRKKTGERFIIFNGEGGEYDAILVSANKKTACVEIGAYHETKTESSLKIHLGQGISRGERMDYAIQKSVELGVTDITPLMTEFCQVQLAGHRIDKRVAHWQAIATSAAEQSGRCAVPIVHEPILFSTWIAQNHAIKLICCPRAEKQSLVADGAALESVAVAIGPEGGFSDNEIKAAVAQQFSYLSLGPRILRTETATVVALSLLQRCFGDLN